MLKYRLFQMRFGAAGKQAQRVTFFAVATVVAAALWLGTNFIVQMAKTSWNERQMVELVENVILRGEFAIDNVILAEVDLIGAGHGNCSAQGMAAIRDAIYRHSALVDIHVRHPLGTCQAFEEFGLDEATILAAKAGALAGRNPNFRFTRLADATSSGLGIVWEFQRDHFMTAVIRTDSLLFDMLPAGIRDDADLVLSLDDGAIVARYLAQSAQGVAATDDELRRFSASSQRYPLSVQLSLPRETIATWHSGPSTLRWLLTALVSAALGLLIARGLVRTPSERELLQSAIGSGEITPYFQPIVSLTTQRVVGCEVLARWIKPDGTQIPPSIFIPLAELSDQSDEMTRALMHQAGRDLGTALASKTDFKINFNITVKQLTTPGFAADFLAYASRCGLLKEQLVVELIERESMDSMGAAKAALSELQSQGIRVAIDDVGTGQNGLALLQSLGADIVKIDKMFVDMIDCDQSSRAISQMLVNIAQASQMSIVAEGVERKEQAATLQAMGIAQAQGFYFARPMPAADFLLFLGVDEQVTGPCATLVDSADESLREAA